MAREIRITVDDDEVFERMKARKRELDLTWGEVLQRGLWVETPPDPSQSPTAEFGSAPTDDLGDRLERQIRQRVEKSIKQSFGIDDPAETDAPADVDDDLDSEQMETLEKAEDGELVFPFLDTDPAYRVPLRVTVEMQSGGVDIDVVAVRQSRSVAEMNSFDRSARKQIAEKLATGSPVTLVLESGVEEYQVAPILQWTRDDGDPTVSDVEIDRVIFDDE